jgi:hypothetical protein
MAVPLSRYFMASIFPELRSIYGKVKRDAGSTLGIPPLRGPKRRPVELAGVMPREQGSGE